MLPHVGSGEIDDHFTEPIVNDIDHSVGQLDSNALMHVLIFIKCETLRLLDLMHKSIRHAAYVTPSENIVIYFFTKGVCSS